MNIQIATAEAEITACFPAIHELRPHLTEATFVTQVQRQMQNHGYTLVYLTLEDEVVAAAGYRLAEYLAWGRILYVAAPICLSALNHLGYGRKLLDWLLEKAHQSDCVQFHLDSGVQRHDAHRLYLGRKLRISSHHFSREIGSGAA